MDIYLVGGAVRDKLLNYPTQERDWVVVGATPKEMLKLGFRQVGRDFPVFLHPKSQEEYALARTERKSGRGYYGFECDFNPNVSLQEDLRRRDLTINAMAMDEHGQLFDPFNGQEDIKAKRLRHVSDAFVEDPVRVLRVARFAARYHHLGFRLAEETRLLMYDMTKHGELNHLVAERVWQEWLGSLNERDPDVFISTLRSCGALQVIFPQLDALFGVPASPKYHPEIDTGIHTLMALKEAVRLSNDSSVRFATLLHDLGKAKTSPEQWPSHPDHDVQGVSVIEALCHRFRVPVFYKKLAVMVCRLHTTIHRLYSLTAEEIVLLFEQADAYRNPSLFQKILLVCTADALGVGGTPIYQQAQDWNDLLTEYMKIDSKSLVAQGYQGVAIKAALRENRIKHINTVWKVNEK